MSEPTQSTSVFGNDNIIVQANGSGVNVTVVSGCAYLRLTQFERRTKLVSRDSAETALLSAYRGDVVPLVGREHEMADLRHWLDSEELVSVRVLVGAGGRGKTRLALELARAVAKEGWLAGFATAEELDRFRHQVGVEQWRWDKPVLAIIDDAASRTKQLFDWLSELVDAEAKLRLLLLERQASRSIGWLSDVFGLGNNDDSLAAIALLDPKDPVEVLPLDGLEFRRAVFGALLKRANSALDAPARGVDPQFDRQLADDKWAGDPLYLMLAGLVAAKSGVRDTLSLSRADLALSIAGNELDRIGEFGAALGVGKEDRPPSRFVRHMAVMATLVQGLRATEARQLAAKEPETFRNNASLDATIAALTDALPAPDGEIAPVRPDVVGEAAIIAWLSPQGALASTGVEPMATINEAASIALSRVAQTLVRVAQDFPENNLDSIRWLESLLGSRSNDITALMEIARAIPSQTLALSNYAEALFRLIVNQLALGVIGARGTDLELPFLSAYTAYVSDFGRKLGQLGRLDEAVNCFQSAIDNLRRFAVRQPEVDPEPLARCLEALGTTLYALDRPEEALIPALEAVQITRQLIAQRSTPSRLRLLASSLGAVGLSRSSLQDSQAAFIEMVQICRSLVAMHLPDDDNSDGSLAALGVALIEVNLRLGTEFRREEALAETREAVKIMRGLFTQHPDTYTQNLALALQVLSATLTDLGFTEDAIAASRECIETYRRLVTKQREAFLPMLGGSLDRLYQLLSEAGLHEEAHKAASEALDVRIELSQSEKFYPELAMSMSNLGDCLIALGRPEHALPMARNAVLALGGLFLKDPSRHASKMAIICKRYVDLAASLQVEPNSALLGPIGAAFQSLMDARATDLQKSG